MPLPVSMTAGVAKQTSDYQPTDLAGNAARDEDKRRKVALAEARKREDLAELLSEERYRRQVRARLRDVGIDVRSDHINSIWNADHSAMSFTEGRRLEGLLLVWQITRMAARREIPFETFERLITESDE